MKRQRQFPNLSFPTDDDLRDLANYKNLKSISLALPLPEDTDFSLLNGLDRLESLSLGSDDSVSYINMNVLSDVRLPELKKLSVYNDYFNASVIPECFPGLENLYIYDCRVAGSYALASLKNLKNLCLENCELNDISFVSELKELKKLWLGDNNIVDISPIAGMTSLELLSISGSPVGDRAGETLKTLSNLHHLAAVRCGIGNLSFLSGCPKMEKLYLDDNPIDDITALGSIENLQDLGLDHTLIDNVEPLRNLQNLWYLNIMDNNITDISPLAECRSLEYIALADNPIPAEDEAEFFENNSDKRVPNPE